MKRCPSCNRTYTDETLLFCLEDGTPLVAADQTTAPTIMMPAEPPPTVAYDTGRVTAPQVQPAWTTTTPPQQKRKVWPFVVGGLLLLLVFGGGLIAAVVWMASVGSNQNSNSNANRVVNANSNANHQPTPTPKLEITRVYLARHDASTAGDEVETFSPSDRTVYCIVELNDAQPGARVTSTWTLVDAGELKNRKIGELEYTTTASRKTFDFHLTNPQDWPSGDYKVEIYLNGQFARSVEYQIE